MRVRSVYWLIGLFVLVVGCSNNPKYYESAKYVSVNAAGEKTDFYEPIIRVDLYASKVPGSKKTTLMSLGPEGQAALVNAYRSTPDELPVVFATPVAESKTESSIDSSRIEASRKFVFTVATPRLHPADRVDEATLIAKAPPGWHFIKAEGFKEVRKDIKVATVVDTLTRKLSAGSGINLAEKIKELVDTKVEGEISAENKVTRDLQFEIVSILPSVSNESVRIDMNARFPQISVAGIFSGTVTLKYVGGGSAPVPKKLLTTHFDLSKAPVTVSRRLVYYAPEFSDLPIDVALSYRARMVSNGDGRKTLKEDDDTVEFIKVGPKWNSSSQTQPDDAIVGKSYPTVQRNLGFAKTSKLEASILMLRGKPLRLFIPAKHSYRIAANCIVDTNGGNLQKLRNWLLSNPAQHRQQKTSSSEVIWEMLDPSTMNLVQTADILAANIKIERILLNEMPPKPPLTAIQTNQINKVKQIEKDCGI